MIYYKIDEFSWSDFVEFIHQYLIILYIDFDLQPKCFSGNQVFFKKWYCCDRVLAEVVSSTKTVKFTDSHVFYLSNGM